MRLARAPLWACIVALSACSAGGGGDDDDDTCAGALLAGDLVVTEIMANGLGADTGNEWFEIYNASGQEADLTGVRLVTSREDGTGEKAHLMTSGLVAPDSYFVLGNVLDAVRPDYVEYGYGSDLGDLRNAGGRIALDCGGTEIDETLYTEMSDGVARGFTGAIAPDYAANDLLTNWCDATTELAPGAFGTPGAPNPACGGGPQNTCDDGGTMRDVDPPAAGDVVISEVLPDPDASADPGGEWLELYVARDLDLNGLELGKVDGEIDQTVSSSTCLHVTTGSYLVFAHSAASDANGMLPVVDQPLEVGLTNTNSRVWVGVGGELLDEVTWTSTRAGKAHSLDPRRLTPAANDDPTSWCDATTPYGAGDLGTPGAANPECDLPPPEGMCAEGDGFRPLVAPVAGQVHITEYMPDPDAADDATGEWFEVRFDAAADLNGLELGTLAMDGTPTLQETIGGAPCIPVEAGAYLLFARSDVADDNGMLPPPARLFDFGLVNSNRGIYVGLSGATLDSVSYTSTTAGVAASLDPDGVTWCPATTPYGAGDLGTPAAANPECP